MSTETVNGYCIVGDWTTAGGGMGKWAFAEKGGKSYFIKQFLRPTYPLPHGPGSEATKKKLRKDCEAFEAHHKALLKSLSGLAGDGGHLIITREFFRVEAKYYKVTDRIETSSLSVSEIASIEPPRNGVILALTIAHSLEILHRQGIVHGDLKPANILPKLASKDLLVAKLIDFDDSYREGDPPPPDEVVGDLTYYSPELVEYIQDEGARESLGCASDIFALGIVLCQYFSGELPEIIPLKGESKPARNVAQAVIRGQLIHTGLADSWPDMNELLLSMMQRNPADRPPIGKVTESLRRIRDLESRDARTKADVTDASKGKSAPVSDPSVSRLKGKGLLMGRSTSAEAAKPSATPATGEPSSTASALRGRLVSPRKDST